MRGCNGYILAFNQVKGTAPADLETILLIVIYNGFAIQRITGFTCLLDGVCAHILAQQNAGCGNIKRTLVGNRICNGDRGTTNGGGGFSSHRAENNGAAVGAHSTSQRIQLQHRAGIQHHLHVIGHGHGNRVDILLENSVAVHCNRLCIDNGAIERGIALCFNRHLQVVIRGAVILDTTVTGSTEHLSTGGKLGFHHLGGASAADEPTIPGRNIAAEYMRTAYIGIATVPVVLHITGTGNSPLECTGLIILR